VLCLHLLVLSEEMRGGAHLLMGGVLAEINGAWGNHGARSRVGTLGKSEPFPFQQIQDARRS